MNAPSPNSSASDRAVTAPEQTLDPHDWDGLRALGHRMLDEMLDHLRTVRDRPDLALSPSNVVAACRSCQNRRIRRPDPATWQLRERTPRRW